MKRIQWVLIMGIIVCFGVTTTSVGQITSSSISGVVRDASQAVIVGSTVVATNVETGIARTTQSDSGGRYRVGELQPGTYQITVTMPGFSRETRAGITLLVGQELTLNFVLQVGAVEQEVVVTGEAPVVETTISSVATNVSQEQLRELPLNGRSFVDLVTLNPGAVTPTAAQGRGANYGAGPQMSVAGARTDSNSFRIDGTDMNATSNNTPGSAAGVQLGVDTIREFQVITSNTKAEYGRNAGAIINAVTRSGTNEWHGAAFEFLRNDKLDARNFFNPEDLPPFKRNQFGATFGGPIQRDQTFFFLGYEGLRQRLTESPVYKVPTKEAHGGVLPNKTVKVDSRVQPFLDLYPFPNGEILGGGIGEFIDTVSQPTGEDFGSVRVDHNFSSNDFLFFRYTGTGGDSETLFADRMLSKQFFRTLNQYYTIQEDHVFSAGLLNTFRAGYNRSVTEVGATDVPGAPASATFVPGSAIGQLGVGGLSALGPSGIAPLEQAQHAFQFEDTLAYTSGGHTMKFGAMVERFRWNTDQREFALGSASFRDLESFFLAGPSGVNGTVLLPESITYRALRTTLLAFFAQDDWRVTPSLTLNLGLRWEFTTGLKEVFNNITYMARGPELSTQADLIRGEFWKNRIKIFEPRLGFNWAFGADQKTALSGGFGIFHNQLLHNNLVSFRAQLPFFLRLSNGNFNFSNQFPDVRAAILAAGTTPQTQHRAFDHDNLKTPTFYRYNLALQREFPGEMALRVAYVGARGAHMNRRQALNVFPIPVTRPDGSLYFPPAPVPQLINPNFGRIEWMSSDVNSFYNSLAVNLQKRFSRGLTFQVSYTWSKSVDDYSQSETNYQGETGANPQYGPDRKLERARSTFNVPHVFVANYIYELPLGSGKAFLNSGGVATAILGDWQIGGVVTLEQGNVFTVGSSAPTAGYQFRANRPNLKPGIDVNTLTGGPRERFFDPTAFTVPPPGTIGNASRNLLLGPPLYTVNFTASKYFSLGERMRLQFRGEFFNLFNHTNFSIPNARVFTSQSGAINPSAGRITQTSTTARQVQLGLKLTF
ncbi:MAG: TonB-dependent receptor [Acidobacteria bacterium]|nr:TonB-dependent receptor [Acidobacteriota bacterium]